MKRTPKAANPANAQAQPNDAKQYLEPHELVVSASVQNAAALELWGVVFGKQGIGDLTRELRAATRKVTKDGEMQGAEAMLYGQAVALQTIFTNLSRRAALNAGEYLGATETYLRLALKAQAQCRATLETLHEMKNPRPVAFVRQANIAHGPQQVNNGPAQNSEVSANDARARESENAQSKLLEGSDGERLDCGAQGAASGANPQLAPVGEVNGTKERSR